MTTPKITVVTPSFNQGHFLESTLTSVLDQGYPNLEYIVMDGGSTDASPRILRHYGDRLAHWRSAPDRGQYDAIQRGFEQSTGEIMAWLNADDLYYPWTLSVVGTLFQTFPEVQWISSLLPGVWSSQGVPYRIGHRKGFSADFFRRGLYLCDPRYPERVCIQQESTFWRRSLWDKAGGALSGTETLAADFDLWARFFQHAPLVGVSAPLAGFRVHGDQRSLLHRRAYVEESLRVLRRAGGAMETGGKAWVRRVGLGRLWPLRILPSLGYVQQAGTLHWSPDRDEWFRQQEWIYE